MGQHSTKAQTISCSLPPSRPDLDDLRIAKLPDTARAAMSLALLESYSSEEEDAAVDTFDDEVDSADERDEHDEEEGTAGEHRGRESIVGRLNAVGVESDRYPDSSLPSASEAFNEITGPPDFLNNMAAAPEETREALGVLDRRAERDRSRREKKDFPSGAVVMAKPQLVGIRDRVRTDVDGASTAVLGSGEGKRVISATNPDKKDAADLLRVCLQCGVPKTYSHNRGMVCPICGDRPTADQPKEAEKRKGSMVKDKEKIKRMRGQSSHATWKSETEMHLRQQYD